MIRKFVTVVSVMLVLVPAGAVPTFAQEQRSPSILEFFGITPSKPKVTIKKPVPKKASPVVKKAPRPKAKKVAPSVVDPSVAANGVAESQTPAIPEKLPDAKTVLVLGDFMADGVSEGIEQVFEQDAGVKVISRANGSSGFVRDDFYNWTQEVSPILAEVKPSVVVFMIGTNDRQPLQLNGAREAVLSPNWTAEYEKRVLAFASMLKTSGIPAVWIGMPPFKQSQMNANMLAFNDIYRHNADKAAFRFVDIWEGFLDDQGAFSINGFDYNGQPARLRASDGINLTFAGKRKIAFFAEKPIRETLGVLSTGIGTPSFGGFDPFSLPGPKKPSPKEIVAITRTTPISLFDPAFDGGSELLGGSIGAAQTTSGLPSQKLYLEGAMPAPVPGRIDQYHGGQKTGG